MGDTAWRGFPPLPRSGPNTCVDRQGPLAVFLRHRIGQDLFRMPPSPHPPQRTDGPPPTPPSPSSPPSSTCPSPTSCSASETQRPLPIVPIDCTLVCLDPLVRVAVGHLGFGAQERTVFDPRSSRGRTFVQTEKAPALRDQPPAKSKPAAFSSHRRSTNLHCRDQLKGAFFYSQQLFWAARLCPPPRFKINPCLGEGTDMATLRASSVNCCCFLLTLYLSDFQSHNQHRIVPL